MSFSYKNLNRMLAETITQNCACTPLNPLSLFWPFQAQAVTGIRQNAAFSAPLIPVSGISGISGDRNNDTNTQARQMSD